MRYSMCGSGIQNMCYIHGLRHFFTPTTVDSTLYLVFISDSDRYSSIKTAELFNTSYHDSGHLQILLATFQRERTCVPGIFLFDCCAMWFLAMKYVDSPARRVSCGWSTPRWSARPKFNNREVTVIQRA
jgi:hypothetical protein